MGRYSYNINLKSVLEKGFLKKKDIPKKYQQNKAEFWFAYYGAKYKNEVAELHARVGRNIGSPVILARFSHRSMGKNKALFKKAMQMEY